VTPILDIIQWLRLKKPTTFRGMGLPLSLGGKEKGRTYTAGPFGKG
jgi:hypothetical protein